MKNNSVWGLHAKPSGAVKYLLAALPFFILLITYLVVSDIRLEANPSDKLLPSFASMWDAFYGAAFEPNRRTGEYLLWTDTSSSLQRLFIGLTLAAVTALFVGLNMGVFPGLAALGLPFVTTVSMIPPLAVLPILFITFGVEETGKIALIFFGTFPLITRDVYMAVKMISSEQITKALTLGASQIAIAYKVVLPQIMPRLLSSLRLSLGAAWLFLIAAEAIAASEGLGYRIFLVRRYLSMDLIIPYVAWITLLGFCIDYALKLITTRMYPWYNAK